MPTKFEHDWMKNEGVVRKNVNGQTNDNNERQTLGVTDGITTAVSIPQC